MAATLSSFISPIFRQNQPTHNSPRTAIEEDFSYSYSALPVPYRSENNYYDPSTVQGGTRSAQRKYLANILNRKTTSQKEQEEVNVRYTKTLPRNNKYDEKNSNFVKKHFEFETTCSNLPQKTNDKSPLDFSDYKTDENKNYEGRSKDDLAVATSVWRLRNSIFSSLKLPRKISPSKMSSVQGGTLGLRHSQSSGSHQSQHKRKSAVELLQETKAFYVKSETVLDRKQELPLRITNSVNSSNSAHYATLSGRHRRGGGEALQSQLRRLLGSTSNQSPSLNDSRKSSTYKESRDRRDMCNWDTPQQSATPSTNRSHYNSGTFSGNSSSGTSGSKGQVKSDPEHFRISNSGKYSTKSLNRPSSSGDNRIFFPDSFVVPKPSRSDPANVFANRFSIGSPFSSPEKIDARKILSVVNAYDTDYGLPDSNEYYENEVDLMDYSTISPPAEYAITEKSNYRYMRSNSHSHSIKPRPDPSIININSHKSLPDLHKQAENYTQEEQFLLCSSGYYLSGYEGSHHSGMVLRPEHAVRSSEALSSYSKATSGRSNKSSVFSSKGSDSHSRRSASCHNSDPSYTGRGSADEVYYYNRSGSSYARDSGGSSGHYSGMGGPPSLPPVPNQAIQQRRDSGSSTQHSSSRSHRYPYYDNYQESAHVEYHVSAPLQFQDGVDTSHHLSVNATLSICAPAGTPGSRSLQSQSSSQRVARVPTVGIHFQASIPPVQFQDPQPYKYDPPFGAEGFYGRRESGVRESRHSMQRPTMSAYNQNNQYGRDHEREEVDEPEMSPPGLGNFKRQRCLRYKQRRPILRSKSDISDRYWRNENGTILSVADKQMSPPSSDNDSLDRHDLHQLNKFFEQLGLDDVTYKEVILDTIKKLRTKNTDTQNNHLPSVKQSPNHDLQQNPNANCNLPKPYTNNEAESSDSLEFSEISDADSNMIANNGDYTVQGIAPKPDPRLYRSCEPPSIVERNARIIKWLCNCRKLQAK